MKDPVSSNYYQVLGLDDDCTVQDIKRNYHQLALIWHPDKHDDKREAELKFTFINEAYTVLSDPSKRQMYDIQRQFKKSMETSGNEPMERTSNSTFDDQELFQFNLVTLNLLRDILQDKDDVTFDGINKSNIPKSFKSTLRSFLDQDVISSDDEYVFSEYQPTFKDKNFLNQIHMFNEVYKHGNTSTQILTTVLEDEIPSENPPLLRRKSSIIIIEKTENSTLNPERCQSSEDKGLFTNRKRTFKFKNTLKRPFLYNEESELYEEQPQKKVKRPQMQRREYCYSGLSEDEFEQPSLSSILNGISAHQAPITNNLSLQALRRRLQSQN